MSVHTWMTPAIAPEMPPPSARFDAFFITSPRVGPAALTASSASTPTLAHEKSVAATKRNSGDARPPSCSPVLVDATSSGFGAGNCARRDDTAGRARSDGLRAATCAATTRISVERRAMRRVSG